jgi:hypothetical protein
VFFEVVLSRRIISVEYENYEYIFYLLTRPTSKYFSSLYLENEGALVSGYYCHNKFSEQHIEYVQYGGV